MTVFSDARCASLKPCEREAATDKAVGEEKAVENEQRQRSCGTAAAKRDPVKKSSSADACCLCSVLRSVCACVCVSPLKGRQR